MVTIDISIRDSPIVLQARSDIDNGSLDAAIFSEIVIVNSNDSGPVQDGIAGVKAIWKVIHQKRELKSHGKAKWGRREVVKRFEVDVIGEMALCHGVTRLEFAFELPSDLPPSRTTAFDRVEHQLQALLFEGIQAPEYKSGSSIGSPSPPQRYTRSGSVTSTSSTMSRTSTLSAASSSSSTSGYSLRSAWTRMMQPGKADNAYTAASKEPIVDEYHTPSNAKLRAMGVLAQCTTDVTLFSTTDTRDRHSFEWNHSEALAEFGSLQATLSADQTCLGSDVNLDMSFTELHSDLTIHSLVVDLVQWTSIAADPSASDQEREISTDRWRLLERGSITRVIPGTIRPQEGDFLWRGSQARRFDQPLGTKGKGKARVDRDFRQSSAQRTLQSRMKTEAQMSRQVQDDTSLDLHETFSLPTPSHGTLPSSPLPDSSLDSPSRPILSRCSSVTHRLDITVVYSVLGRGTTGAPLTTLHARSESLEGAVRRTCIPLGINVTSCMSSYSAIPAPAYSSEDATDLRPYEVSSAHKCTRSLAGFRPDRPRHSPPYTPSEWIDLAHMKSVETSSGTWLRPVKHDREETRKRSESHRQETQGKCLCFTRRDTRPPADLWSRILPSPTKVMT